MNRTFSLTSILPPAILIGAVCFNAVLAIVNGHVIALSRGSVVLAELAIYAAALGVIITHADRRMQPWFLLTVFIIANGVLLAFGNGEFNAKYIRDVLVIPVFIMLGMTYADYRITIPVLILHSIIFAVGVIEIASPEIFSDIFRILAYYVNTRDFSANSFWNTESTLFISATRPGARFFGFVDWHRGSSIFLEPVSLGNYCVVAVIWLLAYWRDLSSALRSYLVGSTLFLLVSSDGRLAATSVAIVFVALIFLCHLSSRWSILYLPAILIASLLYINLSGPTDIYDNFAGRVAGTVNFLSSLDLQNLAGLTLSAAEQAADNGIVYFILSQSVLGLIVIWSTICVLSPDRTITSRLYVHSVGLFVPLNLLVSYSFFSIKVASLIWFIYGHRYMADLAISAKTSNGDSLVAFPTHAA